MGITILNEIENCLPEENEITVAVLTFNFVHCLDTTMAMSVCTGVIRESNAVVRPHPSCEVSAWARASRGWKPVIAKSGNISP
jgi:hypothetical protein